MGEKVVAYFDDGASLREPLHELLVFDVLRLAHEHVTLGHFREATADVVARRQHGAPVSRYTPP